jgi:hypothetical protein
MDNNVIFLPVLAHMLLVFGLYIFLGKVKSLAVKEGQVDRQKAALNSREWPEYVVKVSNNLANQFESPILFYMLSVMYYLSDNVSAVLIILLSLYTISRYVHAYVHVTSNYVPYRFKSFLVGVLILLALTFYLVFNILVM